MAGNQQQTPLVPNEGGDRTNTDHVEQSATQGMPNEDACEQRHRHYDPAAQDLSDNQTCCAAAGSFGGYSCTDHTHHIDKGKGAAPASAQAYFSGRQITDWQNDQQSQHWFQLGHGTVDARESTQEHQRRAMRMIEEIDAILENMPRPSSGESQGRGHSNFEVPPRTEVDQNGQILSEMKGLREFSTAIDLRESQRVVPWRPPDTPGAEMSKPSVTNLLEEANLTALADYPSRRIIIVAELEVEYPQLHPFGNKADLTIHKLLRRWEGIRQHNQKEPQQSHCDNQGSDSPKKSGPSQEGKRTRRREDRPEDAGLLQKKQKQTSGPGSDRDFACPFIKRDLDRWWGTCCRFHTPKMSYVKQHIKRSHPSEPHVAEALAPRLKSAQPESEQWYSIFDILFPDQEPRPPSPYYVDLASMNLASLHSYIGSCEDLVIWESFSTVSSPTSTPTIPAIRRALNHFLEGYMTHKTTNDGGSIAQSRSTWIGPSTVPVIAGPTMSETSSSAQAFPVPHPPALNESEALGLSSMESTPHPSVGDLLVIDPRLLAINTTEAPSMDSPSFQVSEVLDSGENAVIPDHEPSAWEQDVVQSQHTFASSVSRSTQATFSDEFLQYDFDTRDLSNHDTAPSTPLTSDEDEKHD
ncbi:uncharacterized protein E0L32_007795 [Thyridium curvatum]|uniref:Uncharacterized protein n=1 Tax=Thyridium curvatum TaxID=1093900 RepID=A0A507AYQ7_9PEZI|nr:uncharacterized protein E0L32_007795 [Thyridium curvatum]TPX11584.1 hypothetical protein E0L32_007795 [Thyridium curvatum]